MFKDWERGNLRITLALGVLAIITVGAIWGSWSYSSAKIHCKTEIVLTEPEDSLIAVDAVNHKSRKSWKSCFFDIYSIPIEHGSSGLCGKITNNMSETQELTISGGFSNYNTILLPGESTYFSKDIPFSEPPGLHEYEGEILARRDGGEALIKFSVFVNVIEPPKEKSGNGHHDK